LALASHDSELADVALSAAPVSLSAQVNNYALAGFGKTSGDGIFAQTPGTTDYVLNFGKVSQGASAFSTTVVAENLAPSLYSDFLSGDFTTTGSGFQIVGLNAFNGLGGGGQTGPIDVTFNTSTAGSFSETIDLLGTGYYAGAAYSPYTVDAALTIEGTVTGGAGAVPEPSTWAMMGLGFLGLGLIGWRSRRAVA